MTSAHVAPASTTHFRLLEAAAALFHAKGYVGTTTRELAAQVGIRNASIYHHIRSKNDLLYTLCIESLTRITEAVEKAIAGEREPVGQLRALVKAHLATSLADQDKHATMLMELRSLSADSRVDVVALRDHYEALVGGVIHEGQAMGAIRSDVSARQSTLALLNLLNWTIFWFHPDGELTADQIASDFASIYLDGIAVRKPQPRRRS